MNSKCVVVGVTGPTGAGKSTVCKIAGKLGATIIDVDKVSHQILVSEKKCIDQLVQAFSCEIIDSDGKIDRRLLADKAFSSKEKTFLLNNITHPFIREKINFMVTEYKSTHKHIIIIDAALLFEIGLEKMCDVVWTVLAPVKTRMERILKRDNLSYDQLVKRLNAQKDDNFYKKDANVLIDGTLNEENLIVLLSSMMEKFR